MPFTPALAEACGCEIIIFAPSVERGWNGSCIGNLPDPLPSRRRHKNGGWKWGWLRQTNIGTAAACSNRFDLVLNRSDVI